MNSKFNKMQERGWTIIPWEIGQPNQAQVLNWCRINGTGEFYYVCESNKINNWCIVIKDPTDATMFKQHFGVE
jgi:hypothetical protein